MMNSFKFLERIVNVFMESEEFEKNFNAVNNSAGEAGFCKRIY